MKTSQLLQLGHSLTYLCQILQAVRSNFSMTYVKDGGLISQSESAL